MKKTKTFDCVDYKSAIQARHAAENANLSAEERSRRLAIWLETSDNEAAQLWRKLKEKKSVDKTATKMHAQSDERQTT